MKTRKIVRTITVLLLAVLLCTRPGRDLLYWTFYGFDDLQTYKAEILECRLWLYLAPRDAEPHFRLGELLADHLNDGSDRQRRRKEAVEEFQSVLSVDNRRDAAYFELGNLARNEYQDVNLANRLYQKCVELNPASFPYQYALSETYEALGDAANAEKHRKIGEGLFTLSYQKPDYQSEASFSLP